MKKATSLALCSFAIIGLSAMSWCQETRPKSLQVRPSAEGYDVLYVVDQAGTGAAAITFQPIKNNLLGIAGLSLSALYVNSTGELGDSRSYFGAMATYPVYHSPKLDVTLGVGLKGIDATSLLSSNAANASGFSFATSQLLAGVGIRFRF